jgi:transcriptional regulator with XRE-family HTH domain
MSTLQHASPAEILVALGEGLRAQRIRQGLSQSELARRAGIGTVALSHLETGHGSSLHTFVSVLKSLGLQEGVHLLVPSTVIDPLSLTRDAIPRRRIKHTRRSRPPVSAD